MNRSECIAVAMKEFGVTKYMAKQLANECEKNKIPYEDGIAYMREAVNEKLWNAILYGGRWRMTRKFIERYQGILADIAAIKADKVTDTVSASSAEFPYSQHTVTVQGVPADWRSQRLSELYRDKAQIELFIEGMADDTIRAIMRYRIKQGLTWEQVAARLKGTLSVPNIKKKYYTFFEKE